MQIKPIPVDEKEREEGNYKKDFNYLFISLFQRSEFLNMPIMSNSIGKNNFFFALMQKVIAATRNEIIGTDFQLKIVVQSLLCSSSSSRQMR